MLRIIKIYDDTSDSNLDTIEQVKKILRKQFPLASEADIQKLPGQLRDPLSYRFRSVLFVAEDFQRKVKGFALMLHVTDLDFCYLEYLSAAPGQTGGGIGGMLYEEVRKEAQILGVNGLFYEVIPDEAHLCPWPELLKQNIARTRFYERYDARPIVNSAFFQPVDKDDNILLFLLYDNLGKPAPISRERIHIIARAVLERKYSGECSEEYIQRVLATYQDNPAILRAPRYPERKKKKATARSEKPALPPIPLIINDGHDIHHVRDRGYVEAPVRLKTILGQIMSTGLFHVEKARSVSERYITRVHDKDYVDYLRRACAKMPEGKSVYPVVFPLRNIARPPKEMEMRAGYFCSDTFTPINHNAFLAARGAVNCAITAAGHVIGGSHFAYALVRPPGHHAEKRAAGGFCYFNSAAIAAEYLSGYGTVAVLDIDFHHGNGTQEIFYERSDVMTLSIHGNPNFAYPFFSGFADELGEGNGMGFNLNYPLPETITAEVYSKTLRKALTQIKKFAPQHLVLSLGLDTAKNDPTGTWPLRSDDFFRNGEVIGALGIPTLIVQEGGYDNRTLGTNARQFFKGLWQGHQGSMKNAKGKKS